MLRVTNIRVSIDRRADLKKELCKKIGVDEQQLISFNIYKESYDARKRFQNFVYSVDIELKDEKTVLQKRINDVAVVSKNNYKFPLKGCEAIKNRPIIIGSGPCGLFAAYLLAIMGYKPLLFERGSNVEVRSEIVNKFWQKGKLQPDTNVQFGEGGAGTFSDGKLTTNINDTRCRFVLELLVENGAPNNITYSYRPHVGTDLLQRVVKNIRRKIIESGGEVRFNSLVTGLVVEKNKLVSVEINGKDIVPAGIAVLAIGHSARDTYKMLFEQGVQINPKAFSVGVRVEHSQKDMNAAQYGKYACNENLEPANYKLKYHDKNGRSAYSFCMCPGGLVVASSSGYNEVVTNGMSYHARNGLNANSALLVGVTPEDFASNHPLAGVYFQQRLEKLAFNLGGNNYYAPVQLVGDFLDNRLTTKLGRIKPSYRPGVNFAMLSDCLPNYVTKTLQKALVYWGGVVKGFNDPEAVLTGVETRSSAPLRIVRNSNFESNISGIYPAGEGAGYAGGIISAAVDGLKVAEAVIERVAPL